MQASEIQVALAGALSGFCDLDPEMAADCAEALVESGVIDRIARERAAKELEAAADVVEARAASIRAHAAVLRATP